MSADNSIGVFPVYDSLGRPQRYYVGEGTMTDIENIDKEQQWKKEVIDENTEVFITRAIALEAAHDKIKNRDYNSPVV